MGLFSGGVAATAEAIGRALDGLVTSDEERQQARILMERLRQQPQALQAEINKIEAGSRSLWVSGWRPFIGWVSGSGLAFVFLINPIIQWCTGRPGPQMPSAVMTELVVALLGLGSLRTAEKITGKAK